MTKKIPKIKEDRGFIMSSAWYTQMGNDFRNWSGSASNLFGASMILKQEEEKERRRLEDSNYVGSVSVAINTHGAQHLLTAFGLESLLKAVWLKNGNKLVADGKYVGLPCENRKKWHNLVSICDDVRVPLQPSERRILKSLSDIGRYHGRYPVARGWEDMEQYFIGMRNGIRASED